MSVFFIILSIIFISVGLVGSVLPYLPGLPLAFLGTWWLARLTDYELIAPGNIWFLGVLTLLSLAADYVAGLTGARRGRASLWGTFGAIVGLAVGLSTLGIAGVIIGPMAGVLVFELVAKGDRRQATRAARATLVGSILGIAASFVLALIFTVSLILMLIF